MDIDPLERRALGILSEAAGERLGPADPVARELRHAYDSGGAADRDRAIGAFDALPGWRRSEIGRAASERARGGEPPEASPEVSPGPAPGAPPPEDGDADDDAPPDAPPPPFLLRRDG